MANKRRDFSKAYAQDKKDREQSEGGFADRRKYLVPAKVLDDLGVREFSTRLEEKEDSRRIKLHVLEPHPDDPAVFGLKLFVHHNVGEEQAAVICPKRQAAYFHEKKITIPDVIKNAQCPICNEADTLVPEYMEIKKSGTQDERDAMWTRMREMRSHGGGYKDIQKPKMYLVWCVDSQDEDAGNQFFMMPGTVYEGMIEQMEGEDDDEFYNILDPEDGAIFCFKRVGKQLETRYSGYKLVNRKNALPKEWTDGVPMFLDILQFHSCDEIEAMMSGVVAAEEDPAEEVAEEFNRTKTRRTVEDVPKDEQPRKRRRVVEEEDDEDDEPEKVSDDDGDEDEEEEAPRQRRRSTRVSEPDDDATVVEDDDDAPDVSKERLKRIRERRAQRDKERGE